MLLLHLVINANTMKKKTRIKKPKTRMLKKAMDMNNATNANISKGLDNIFDANK